MGYDQNGSLLNFVEDASGTYVRTKNKWQSSDGQSGENDPPALKDLAWQPGLAEGLDQKFPDTENGPIDLSGEPEAQTSTSPWPSWTYGDNVEKEYGQWVGKSKNRSHHITVEVRVKKKSGGGGGGGNSAAQKKLKSYLRVVYEKDPQNVETVIQAEAAYSTANANGTVSEPIRLDPQAPENKNRREKLFPIELMQPQLANWPIVEGNMTATNSVNTVRFCRWRDAYKDASGNDSDGILKPDFIASDPDRCVVRISPDVVASDNASVEVRVTGITGVSAQTEEDVGVMKLAPAPSGVMETKPLIFVADHEDDGSYNGVAGEGTAKDGKEDDQTRLAGFGATIQVILQPKGYANPVTIDVATMMQPLKQVKVSLNMVTLDGQSATDAQKNEISSEFQVAKLIYRQIGYDLTLIKQGDDKVGNVSLPAAYHSLISVEHVTAGLDFYHLDGKTAVSSTGKTIPQYFEDKYSETESYQWLFLSVDDMTVPAETNAVGGYAEIDGNTSLLALRTTKDRKQIPAHELGHNMGLIHPDEANDPRPNNKQWLMRHPGRTWEGKHTDQKRFFHMEPSLLYPTH